jgi:hypothetical protein
MSVIKLISAAGLLTKKFFASRQSEKPGYLCNDTIKIIIHWMIDKYNNNNIRVFKELKVSKESSHFVISSKDRLHRVGSYKQEFFGGRSAFPELKSCRIPRRHTDKDTDIDIDDKEFDIKRKIVLTERKLIPTTTTDSTPMAGSINPTTGSIQSTFNTSREQHQCHC